MKSFIKLLVVDLLCVVIRLLFLYGICSSHAAKYFPSDKSLFVVAITFALISLPFWTLPFFLVGFRTLTRLRVTLFLSFIPEIVAISGVLFIICSYVGLIPELILCAYFPFFFFVEASFIITRHLMKKMSCYVYAPFRVEVPPDNKGNHT